MSQLILDPVLSGYNLAKVNDNFKRIEEAFNTLLLHKDGSKALTSDLDVNSQKLLNVGGIEIGGVDLLESIASLQETYNAYVSEMEAYKSAVEGILDEAISYGAVDKKSIGNAQAVFTTNQAYAKNSNLTLPLKYIVGKNTLRLSLGHTYLLYKGVDYEEVGVVGEESQTIKILRASGIGVGVTIEQVVDGDNDLIEIFENAQSLYTLLTTNYSPTKVEEFINSVSDVKELGIEDKISELWGIYNNLSALQVSFANTVSDINTKYSTITDMYEDVSTKYSVLETLYPQLVALIADTDFNLDELNTAVANILSAIQELQALTGTIESNAQTASTAATSASTSASEATQASVDARSYSSSASDSAKAAATSATNAANSATASANSASAAAASATSAQTYASNAANSASAAQTYASNAANSASAAQAAQAAAQAIVDTYREASDEAGRLVASADQIIADYQNSAADIATMVEGSDEAIAIRELDIQHSAKTWAQLIEDSAEQFVGFNVNDYYKKTEVDAALNNKADATALSDETAARQSADATNATNITNLSATVSELEGNLSELVVVVSNKIEASDLADAMSTKQDTLTFDTTPTAGSSNPVTSTGIKTAIETAVANVEIAVDDTVTDSSSNPVKSSGIFSHVKACVPKSIGSGTKPVYSNANGVITESGSNVGSITRPICMVSGTLTQCTHTLEKSVPSDAEFLPSQTGNAGKVLTTDGTTASWQPVQTRNIGELVLSAIPLTDAGLHLLDGSLLPSGGVYAQFVQHINGLQASYPDLFVTQADFDASVSAYGSCGKFVVTSSGVRLPKVSDILQGTTDATAVGDLIEAGLPNIAGEFNAYSWGNAENEPTGAFKQVSSVLMNSINSGNGVASRRIGIDASLSSPVYGKSTTVQPQTIKALLYIVVATSTKTDVEVNIDNVVTDLNGKADRDLSNATAPVLSAPYVVEEWRSGANWYRRWSSGEMEQGGIFDNGSNARKVSTMLTFKYPFTDTNFDIFASGTIDGTSGFDVGQAGSRSKSKTGIFIEFYGNSDNDLARFLNWRAKGRWK